MNREERREWRAQRIAEELEEFDCVTDVELEETRTSAGYKVRAYLDGKPDVIGFDLEDVPDDLWDRICDTISEYGRLDGLDGDAVELPTTRRVSTTLSARTVYDRNYFTVKFMTL